MAAPSMIFSLYKICRPQVTPQIFDEELFDIMPNMLGHLSDNHIRLMTDKKRFIYSPLSLGKRERPPVPVFI